MRPLVLALVAALLLTACSRPLGAPLAAPPAATGGLDPHAAPTLGEAPYLPGDQHRQALQWIDDGEYLAAEAALREVVAGQPGAAEAWNDLSLVQAKLGRYRDAAASARRALEARSGFAHSQYNLGLALLQTSDGWREARPYLEASAMAQPDRPEPLYALGLWHKYAGDLTQAKAALQKASSLNYDPASAALISLDAHVGRSAAIGRVVSQFPDAPVQIIWDSLTGYTLPGFTRTIEQVMPILLKSRSEIAWAVLVHSQSSVSSSMAVEFRRATPEQEYLGSCVVPGGAPVTLRTLTQVGGQHLLAQGKGGTVVCARTSQTVEVVFQAPVPVTVMPDGLMADGILYRFDPNRARYLPAAKAATVDGLVAELQGAGHDIKAAGTASATIDLGADGGTGLAVAWREGVAFKPNSGGAAAVHLFKDGGQYAVRIPSPSEVGMMTVPGRRFIAVQTLMLGGPNGADVLVLEYDTATNRLRPVFAVYGDGAGFGASMVYRSMKRYLPQGGFERYVDEYTWDAAKNTFVLSRTYKAN